MKMVTVIAALGFLLGGCGADPTCECSLDEMTTEDFFKIMYAECYEYCHALADLKEQCGDFVEEPMDCVQNSWYEGWTPHNCTEKLMEVNEKIANNDCVY